MRSFPFSPRTTLDLEVGDFWAFALPSGGFGDLQVRDLQRQGPGSRSALVVGVVDWRGESVPTASDLAGRRVLDQGLTRVEVFTEGGAQVIGNVSDTESVAGLTSAFRDFAVGTVTQAWGWKALPSRVERVLTSR